MAETWIANAQAVTYAAAKDMFDIFNTSSSAKTIQLYRAHLFNNQTSAVTGVLNTLNLFLCTAAPTSGTTVTPVKMDTANAALDANTTIGYGRTLTTGALLRQLVHSGDEPGVGTLDWDSLQCTVPFSMLWDVGYGDANIQPFTMNAGEDRGFAIVSNTQTVGQADMEFLFTSET